MRMCRYYELLIFNKNRKRFCTHAKREKSACKRMLCIFSFSLNSGSVQNTNYYKFLSAFICKLAHFKLKAKI